MRALKMTVTVQLADDDDIDVLREENTIRTSFLDFLEDLGERDMSFNVTAEEGLPNPAPRRRRTPRLQPNGPAPDTLLHDLMGGQSEPQPEISPDL